MRKLYSVNLVEDALTSRAQKTKAPQTPMNNIWGLEQIDEEQFDFITPVIVK